MLTLLNFSNPISYRLVVFACLLVVATIIFYTLHRFSPSSLSQNLKQRTNSWWVIFALFILLMGIDNRITFIGFAFISFIAHREMVSNISLPFSARRTILWSYLAIPIQYALAYYGNYMLFITFIPLTMCFLLSLRTIIEDSPEQSLQVFSQLLWSLLITTYTISHIVYFISLPAIPGTIKSYQSFIFFLIFICQVNDIFQYISGKIFGRFSIAPQISPNKTYAGVIGGILGSSLLAYSFSSLMPLTVIQSVFLGAIISVTGFLGDLNISAIKRSLNVKNMSDFIPGHGGILDRIDSLTFSSVIYFYLIYYWIYA